MKEGGKKINYVNKGVEKKSIITRQNAWDNSPEIQRKFPDRDRYVMGSSFGDRNIEVERSVDKTGEVTPDSFFSVNKKFQDKLDKGLPVDWHASFTGKEGLAAASDALEKGHIDQTKYDELTSIYNTQLERQAVDQGGTDKERQDVLLREFMADNPDLDWNEAREALLYQDGEYQDLEGSANRSIYGGEEGTEFLAEDIVEGDKEVFDSKFIEKQIKKGKTEEEAMEMLESYYSNIDKKI